MTTSLEYLSRDQIDYFETNGYLCVPSVFTPEQCHTMLLRSKQMLRDFDLNRHPLTTFSTGEGDRAHVGDEYFLTSGDKIRYFFEEDAIDSSGRLTVPKARNNLIDWNLGNAYLEQDEAINKIGHALHELDPVFRSCTLENERLRSIARDLKFHKDPSVLQSMVICKQRRIGGAVNEHCDSTFLYTEPPSALGFWIPLETCTEENGALSFLPGSHKTNVVSKRLVRLEAGTGFETIAGVEERLSDDEPSKYKLLKCNPGDLVLIHGTVLHKSERNTSENTRFAYTFHMIESQPFAVYDKKNWLQPTKEMPFSKLFSKT